MNLMEKQEIPKFVPQIGLRNGHVQSMLASVRLRRPFMRKQIQNLSDNSVPHLINCEDAVQLHGYYSGHTDKKYNDLIILIHGWEGCAESMYMQSAGSFFYLQGYDVFRLHLRDHGPTHHLNEEPFHACRLDEVTDAVKQICDKFKKNRVFLVGYSLGGNFALRVGNVAHQKNIPLTKVAAVSPVLNSESTLSILESGWVLYRKYFLKKWRKSLYKKHSLFPNLMNWDQVEQCDSLLKMTEYLVEEYTDYDNAVDYFQGYAVTGSRLSGLQVPSRIFAANDDPVIPAYDLDNIEASSKLSISRSEYGGHCGFIQDYQLTSWIDQQLFHFFSDEVI
ncbi:MAG: putative alpha/beta-fold hydrolase [bacterium]|jgi:predicted alpha/beta-fold hydrolase